MLGRLILLCLLLGISASHFSCSSGKNAYEKGYYDRAVFQAVKRLKSRPDHTKSQEVLKKAYYQAVRTYMQDINRAKSSGNPLRHETMLRTYQSVNRLGDEIESCPACLSIIPNPTNYTKELENEKRLAAAARIELGLNALEAKNIRSRAIEAYEHFKLAQRYDPYHPDIMELILESEFYATLKVVVDPIPSPLRTLDIRHEFFENKINEQLHRDSGNEFIRFYTAQEARNMQIQRPDHVITMSFENFRLGDIRIREREKTVSKDSVIISKTRGRNIYGTVQATVTYFEKTVVASGLLDFRIVDGNTNRVLTNEKINGSYTWLSDWARYNGDKRALSEEDLDLVQKRELPTPSQQFMFSEMTKPLEDQVLNSIYSFYRNY